MPETKEKKRVVVLGVDRSGTSCIAGCLHYLGIDMNASAVHRQADNQPTGYWEDPHFNRLSEKARSGSKGVYAPYIAKRRDWLLWGIKDPRLIFTFEQFLGALDIPPHIIVIYRPLAAIQSSWSRCGNNDDDEVKRRVALRHAAVRLASARKLPIRAISYDHFCRNPLGQLRAICHFLGLPKDNVEKAAEHVDPTLNHGVKETQHD